MTTATKSIRIVSALCFVIGAIQFAISMKTFASFSSGTNFGAWWSGIMLMICSLIGAFATTKCRMILGMSIRSVSASHTLTYSCSLVTIVATAAGAAFDGWGFSYFDPLVTCSNSDFKTFGENKYDSIAHLCAATEGSHDCFCVRDSVDDDAMCYLFGLSSGDNCMPVLEAADELLASCILNAVGFVIIFAYCIVTCGSVCCPAKCCGYANEEEEAKATKSADIQMIAAHV